MRRYRVVSMLGLALIATVVACGGPRQIQLTASEDIPAATSTAKVSTSSNGNTKVDLVVDHLALPSRINPSATVYMVWVRGTEPGAYPQSLGALRVDDALKGSISAVTALRSFELFVTAEPSQDTATPTGRRLLHTTVIMK